MSRKATIGCMIASMVVFLALAGAWSAARMECARLGAAHASVPLEQHVRASAREQLWFNAMFVTGNMTLVLMAHLGALQRRGRVMEPKGTRL